jgi:two-component system alkaline phosphatase synthesis response regulator PhoP
VILVVEDDENVLHLVSAYLEHEGYEVVQAGDGWIGLAEAERRLPDLLVVDLMLPGLSGLELASRLKASRKLPIVMLTSKGEEQDVLAGFDAGADDYLTKPFSPKVLVARVRAVLHRAGLAPSAADDRFRQGDITLDVPSRQVYRSGREVNLTAGEFDLLRVLIEHPGWVYTREQLLEGMTGYSWVGDSRAVDVHVANLRKKVEEDPTDPQLIRTVRGVGYKFQR